MRRTLYVFILTAILVTAPNLIAAGKAPRTIAGFVLGDQVATHVDQLRMETALPIRDQEYLRTVEIRDMDGYKSGDIAFGNCAAPGQIIRIKLKYESSDKEFYDQLLDRFKKRFGEPDEWRGDPFHVIIAWKWSFTDDYNNKISLILQYSRDEEYKWGNSVKLTNTTQLEKERICYDKKHPKTSDSDKNESAAKKRRLKQEDYQRFVPE